MSTTHPAIPLLLPGKLPRVDECLEVIIASLPVKHPLFVVFEWQCWPKEHRWTCQCVVHHSLAAPLPQTHLSAYDRPRARGPGSSCSSCPSIKEVAQGWPLPIGLADGVPLGWAFLLIRASWAQACDGLWLEVCWIGCHCWLYGSTPTGPCIILQRPWPCL